MRQTEEKVIEDGAKKDLKTLTLKTGMMGPPARHAGSHHSWTTQGTDAPLEPLGGLQPW